MCILKKLTIKSLRGLYYPHPDKRGNLTVTIIPALKKNDPNSCRLFSVVFAADMSEI